MDSCPRQVEENIDESGTTDGLLQDPSLYNPHKIPPSLHQAQMHYSVNAIGEPLEPDHKDFYVCPYCLHEKKKPFEPKVKASRILGYGSAIPLYFQFIEFMLGYYCIIALFSLYPAYQMASLFFDYEIRKKGFSIFMLFSIIFDYSEKFLHDMKKEVYLINLSALWLDVLCNFMLFLFSTYVHLKQEQKIRFLRDNIEIGPQDFTVMIGNVHHGDPPSKIKRFLDNKMLRKGFPKPRIIKMTKGSFHGNVVLIDIEIEEKKKVIEAMEQNLEKLEKEDGITEDKLKIGRSVLESRRSQLNALIKKKEAWVQYTRKREKDLERHCIVFVTFATILETDAVLSCRTRNAHWISRALFPKYRAPYKIMEAPSPEDVQWKNIGFSTRKRYFRLIVGFLIMLINMLLFIPANIIFNYIQNFVSLYFEERNSFLGQFVFGTCIISGILAGLVEIFKAIINFSNSWQKLIKKEDLKIVFNVNLIFAQVISYIIAIVTMVNYQAQSDQTNNPFQMWTVISQQAYLFMIVQIIIIPLVYVFDPEEWLYILRQKFIGWNLKTKEKWTTPYHFMTQAEVNDKFDRIESVIDFWYVDEIYILILVVLHFMYARFLIFAAILFVYCHQKVCRYLAFRRHGVPAHSCINLARSMRYIGSFVVPRIFTIVRFISFFSTVFMLPDENGELPLFVLYFACNTILIFMVFLPIESLLGSFVDKKFSKKIDLREMIEKISENKKLGKKSKVVSSFGEEKIDEGLSNEERKKAIKKNLLKKKTRKILEKRLQRTRRGSKLSAAMKKAKVRAMSKKHNRKSMYTEEYSNIYYLFDTDYDRENPITHDFAFKEWKKDKIQALRKTSVLLNGDISQQVSNQQKEDQTDS